MLSDKAVAGLRRWLCIGCKITLGFQGENLFILRESRGKVEIDIQNATIIKRKCSVCGTENTLIPKTK